MKKGLLKNKERKKIDIKNKCNKIIEKIRNIDYKKIKKDIIFYLKTNILAISFLICTLLNGILLRYLTVKNYFAIKPILGDLIVILLIIAFAYLIKPKNQFKYFLVWSIIFTLICFINCVYYSNYISFVSVSLLKTSSELSGYSDAVTNIIELKDFIFFWQIIALCIINKKLKIKDYYEKVKEIEVGKVRIGITACLVLFFGLIFLATLTKTDFSRLNKQWNRGYTVMAFGIYTYQVSDLVSSARVGLAGMFNSNDAYVEFSDYIQNNDTSSNNKYTNLFQGKNVIVIHGESLQSFTMNLKFNGQELTPTLNKLTSEGIYFSNFYAQESIGNSSDSEFTSLSSLLPVTNGTVFINYFDRDYVTLPSLLKENGYYTFSMHGNVASAWNRNNAYKSLGYDKFYAYKDSYDIDEVLGLGLSDKSFFKQSVDIIDEIEKNNGNFYGTMVMLTNHTPFTSLEGTEYEDDYLVDIQDEDGNIIPYLEGTKIGNYLKTVNYADSALNEFINLLDERGLLDNTVIVLYGDHDCKLKKSEFEKLYYSEYINDVSIDSNKIVEVVDDYSYEINRKVPFFIWSKDLVGSEYTGEIDEVMGMIDIMPTLGNMLGINNKFALGHDMFSTDENVVVFPDGSFITNKIYYDSSNEEYRQIDLNSSISLDYLVNYQEYANKLISISNNTIVYNFINKYNELNTEY